MRNFLKNVEDDALVTPNMIPDGKTSVRMLYDIRMVTGDGKLVMRFDGISDFPDALETTYAEPAWIYILEWVDVKMGLRLKEYITGYFMRLFTEHKRKLVEEANRASNPDKPNPSDPPVPGVDSSSK